MCSITALIAVVICQYTHTGCLLQCTNTHLSCVHLRSEEEINCLLYLMLAAALKLKSHDHYYRWEAIYMYVFDQIT